MSLSDLHNHLMRRMTAMYLIVIKSVLEWKTFIVAISLTWIYYYPSLRNGSSAAGFLFSGDMLGWYFPALIKNHQLINSGLFTALDFSTYNASSDFFLSPNFFHVHPLIVLFSLVVPFKRMTVFGYGQIIVAICAWHSFIACYFSIKLLNEKFSFSFLSAVVVSIIFSFCFYMTYSLNQLGFLFSATMIPWVSYSAIKYVETCSIRDIILGSLPVVFCFTCGYAPLGVWCIIVSVVLVFLNIFVFHVNRSIMTFIRSMFPYALGTIVVFPYLYCMNEYHHETISGRLAPTLFYAAHQLAEPTQTFLRFISQNFLVPGPYVEFSVNWGIPATILLCLFVFAGNFSLLTRDRLLLIKVCAGIYALTVLSIFGIFTPLSDFIYYFVPIIGSMHIYQRLLVGSNIFFAIIIAIAVENIIVTRPLVATRWALAVLGASTMVVAFTLARRPDLANSLGLTNHVLYEALLALVIVSAFLLPGRRFIYIVVIVGLAIPTLNSMYGYSRTPNTLQEQKVNRVSLNSVERDALVRYMKRLAPKKDIIKYVDISPMWVKGIEPFPKVFPYFVLRDINLSSYGGFTFYLSSRAEYMDKMPVEGEATALNPNWNIIINSGADFIVAMESDLKSGKLPAPLGEDLSDIFRLHSGAIVLPLKPLIQKFKNTWPGSFDNGYVRVEPRVGYISDTNLARGKTVSDSGHIGNTDATVVVDGNTDGNFNHGTVFHSKLDPNAWVDIDLGVSKPINFIKIWGRTDCCWSRLTKYWLFISDEPFTPYETTELLKKRVGVMSIQGDFAPTPTTTFHLENAKGRYIRIQLPGGANTGQNYLSFSELEAHAVTSSSESLTPEITVTKFKTNNANYLELDFTANVNTTLQYLLWRNPRAKFTLDGKQISLTALNNIALLAIPAGSHVFKMQYQYWMLTIFWIIYFSYGIILFFTVFWRRFLSILHL